MARRSWSSTRFGLAWSSRTSGAQRLDYRCVYRKLPQRGIWRLADTVVVAPTRDDQSPFVRQHSEPLAHLRRGIGVVAFHGLQADLDHRVEPRRQLLQACFRLSIL